MVQKIYGVIMSRILFHLNCLEQGGAERVVSTLANAFAKTGDEVLVATEWIGENEFELDDNVTRILVGPTPEEEKNSRISKAITRITRLKKALVECKVDVAISFGKSANYRLLMSGKFLEIPIIMSVRSNPVGNYESKIDKIMGPLLYPRADGAVFQTVGQREFFPLYLQNKSTIILNPVNEKYVGVPRTDKPDNAVVYSGRIVDFKNQSMLLRAFIRVHKAYPDMELRLYGGDSGDGTWEILEKIISDNNAAEYIKLLGASGNLEQELSKGRLFAFSSDEEGLPNSVIEAMALGLPVVSTDCPCGGPRTIIENEINGLLVPVGDEKAMAAAMVRLIENPDFAEKLGKKAREIVNITESNYIIDQWKNYIEQVIKRRYSRE